MFETYIQSLKTVMIEWMKQQTYKFEKQEQSGEFYQKYKDLYKIEKKTAEAILRSENLFYKPVFKTNFTDNFIQTFSNFKENKQKIIFACMNYIVQGHFSEIENIFDIQELPYKGQSLEKMFSVNILNNKHLIFIMTIQQIPITNNNQALVKVDFLQCIVFLDVIANQQLQQLKDKTHPKVYNKVMTSYINEPGYIVNHSMISPQQIREKNPFLKTSNGDFQFNYIKISLPEKDFSCTNPLYDGIPQYIPNKFFIQYIQPHEQHSYEWDAKNQRWVLQNKEFLLELQSVKDYQEQVNEYVISQCLNFGSASKLVEVLQKIPNFKVKLSSEQAHIISCSGNVVCIGRSGTGKTTSAVLRMFALEMLFKYRLSLYHQKNSQQLKKTRFNPKDIDKNVGIRCIFVTASPVLTNEIKRYYGRLTKQLKEELIKRDEKIHAEELDKQIEMKQQKESELDQNQIDQEFDDEKQQVELMMEKDFENLTLKKDISHDDAASNEQQEQQKIEEEKITFEEDDQEKLERDMNKYENLNSMSPHDFPAFMTIRNLIMLIDASLKYPFFKRNKEGKIRGQTVQNTWHNEQKGTLFINNFHKYNVPPGELKESDGFPKEADISDEEDEDELDDNLLNDFQISHKYSKAIRDQEKKINQITAQKLKQINYQKKMAYEIDFEYFKRFFWKRVQNKLVNFKTLDVHFVWTEIYSNIKGSSHSTYYWSGYNNGLTKNVFKENQNRLNNAEVNKLFEIYYDYEAWKHKEGCYDFMDVVNYIIRQMNYGSNRNLQLLHYIMVDEVQDLPMNVLLLMKKLCSNGIFYSGDTAQTIAQGVGFRYGSLKQLFNASERSCNSLTNDVTIQQLTINFRSHNRILYLANSVIDLIEFFFPETIDRLKKEKSSIDGPKPIILGEGDPELLFCILTGQQNYKSERHSSNEGSTGRNPVEFGCSQVVLVRNQESKKRLPPMLSHALCLTIYEAKGLEFDDVILYNFFEDSTMDPQKWNLLRYVQYKTKHMNREEYDTMIADQEIDRIHKLHYVQLLRRDIIEQEWKDRQLHQKLKYIKDDKEREDRLKILNDRKIQRDKRVEELLQQEQTIQSDAVYGIEKKGDKNIIQVVQLDINKTSYENNKVSQKDYSQLCLELKQLYVAITRPKNRIIIYDDNSQKRQILQEYWETLGCVEVINKEVIQGAVDQSNVQESGINIKDALLLKSDINQWKQQGFRMMKMRYYQQAMLCFEKSMCFDLMEQAKIFHMADHAKELLEESQREQIFINEGIMEYAYLSKSGIRSKQQEINAQIKQARKEFTQVGEDFFIRGQFKQAAKCFFSSLNYTRAADAYLKIGNKRSAAECYYIMQDFMKAYQIFLEINEYVKAIECLDLCDQWGKILEVINLAKGKMAFKTREIYIKRYAPLALEELVQSIGLSQIEVQQRQEQRQKKILELIVQNQINEDENEQEEDEEGNEEDNNNQENEEEDSNNESEEDMNNENNQEISDKKDEKKNQQEGEKNLDIKEEDKKQKNEENANKETQKEEESCEQIDLNNQRQGNEESHEQIILIPDQQQSKQNITKDSVMDIDFSIIDQSKSQMQDVSVIEKSKTKHDNTSFINDLSFNSIQKDDVNDLDISNLSLDIIKTKNLLSEFDHLSEIDPEDEWLKMETGSIAEVIQSSRNSGIFQCSEFSSINMMDLVSTKAQMIKTSADIFIQDEIMQQVIKYMSMFSDNFKAEIIKIKSKEALLTSRNEKNDETLTDIGANDLLIDLDNIDTTFLYLILDTLEHYNIFRLAIFVCNRYKLTRKVGRYLISIAHKFSPLAFEQTTLDVLYLNPTPEKQKRMEKNMVANIAIHNLFEVINPEFLRLKEEHEIPTENNSLGVEVFRGFLSLGYWKKILFCMDYKRSLNLAYYFSDFNSYKTIFLTMNKKYKNKAACISSLKNNEPDFECMPFDIPKTEDDIQFAIVVLEHLISFQTSKPKLSKSTMHNLSFNSRSQMLGEVQYNKIPKFPNYFKYNSIFWNYINNKILKSFAKNNDEDREFFKQVGQCCKEAMEILTKKEYLKSEIIKIKIFDFFSFYSNLIFQLQFQDKLAQILIQHLDLDDFLYFSQVTNFILKMFKSTQNLTQIDYLILRAIICPLKARLNINNSDLLNTIGQIRVCVHKSSRLISYFLTANSFSYVNLEIPSFSFQKIQHFDTFCLKKYGKILEKYKPEYEKYRQEQKSIQQSVMQFFQFNFKNLEANFQFNRSLLKKGDKKSIQSAEYLLEQQEDMEKLNNYIKEIEFKEMKLKKRFYFLDLECDFISAPLDDIVDFLKDEIYKLIIPISHRKILGQIRLSGTKNYSIERLFKMSAYNIAYSDLMKEADFLMNRNNGDILLNKAKDYNPPDYKKFSKSNPLYKFYKIEYLMKKEEENQEEDDEEIQKFYEFSGQNKQKKSSIPLFKKCKRQISQCLQQTYQGYWDTSLNPYVKQTLLNISLKAISKLNVQIAYDLNKVQKQAMLLHLLGSTHYIYQIKSEKHMTKYVNYVIENVYNARNGLIENQINNTLNVQEKFFEQLEINEKVNQIKNDLQMRIDFFLKLNNLEYCAIWATISYLASQDESFNFHLSQNFLKYLPPLKFTEFTTDLKDENTISVPARFALEISILPIKTLDIIADIFQYIYDSLIKQQSYIVSRKIMYTKVLNIILIVLFNLKKINNSLAQKILTLIDLIDQEESVSKIISQINFWEDLVNCKDEMDIEDLIPLFISENVFAYQLRQEKADLVQEIYIENIVYNNLTEESRKKMCQSQILKDQYTYAIGLNSSKEIINSYNYHKQEIVKGKSRLCRSLIKLLHLSRFNEKQQLSTEALVNVNIKDAQIFHFFEINDGLISDILFNISLNNIFDPLDYHYLLLLLDQASRKQEEYEKILIQITQENDFSLMASVQKLVNETITKKEDLLKWATTQFSKENQDPQIFFLQNKMSIAIKWAKLGYLQDAKRLVNDISEDYKVKEASYLKTRIKNTPVKIEKKYTPKNKYFSRIKRNKKDKDKD